LRKLLFALWLACAGAMAVAAPPEKTGEVKSFDGMRIAYEARGAGDITVVLVHGWSCDRSYFRYQLASLSTRYQVVAIDLAGHGESSLGRQNSTITSYGEDVAAVVKKLGLKRVVLVGHSMGGDVVVAAARLLKGRVAGLIWLDDYKSLGPPRSDADIEAFVARFRTDFPAMVEKMARRLFRPDADPSVEEPIIRDMKQAPPQVAIPSLESSFKYEREIPGALAALKLPVIAINADIGPTDEASLAKYGVKTVVMYGVGHFMMLEDPPRFDGLLDTAIKAITEAGK